ncbi:hypothetical protein LZ32DRAFT_160121 [Colletotrichum eremochloae]|nr:hypothetical protein LZ32DRAFT_160121 [Colletotrichum eremochloae]
MCLGMPRRTETPDLWLPFLLKERIDEPPKHATSGAMGRLRALRSKIGLCCHRCLNLWSRKAPARHRRRNLHDAPSFMHLGGAGRLETAAFQLCVNLELASVTPTAEEKQKKTPRTRKRKSAPMVKRAADMLPLGTNHALLASQAFFTAEYERHRRLWTGLIHRSGDL